MEKESIIVGIMLFFIYVLGVFTGSYQMKELLKKKDNSKDFSLEKEKEKEIEYRIENLVKVKNIYKGELKYIKSILKEDGYNSVSDFVSRKIENTIKMCNEILGEK